MGIFIQPHTARSYCSFHSEMLSHLTKGWKSINQSAQSESLGTLYCRNVIVSFFSQYGCDRSLFFPAAVKQSWGRWELQLPSAPLTVRAANATSDEGKIADALASIQPDVWQHFGQEIRKEKRWRTEVLLYCETLWSLRPCYTVKKGICSVQKTKVIVRLIVHFVTWSSLNSFKAPETVNVIHYRVCMNMTISPTHGPQRMTPGNWVIYRRCYRAGQGFHLASTLKLTGVIFAQR